MEGITFKSTEEEKIEKRKPKQMKKMWKKTKDTIMVNSEHKVVRNDHR